MKTALLVGSTCLLGLLSTIGAALPFPILPPLFASTAANGFNHFLALPPKFLFGLALALVALGNVWGGLAGILLLGAALSGWAAWRLGAWRELPVPA